MNWYLKAGCIFFVLLLFAMCENPAQESSQARSRVRAAFRSGGNNVIKASVFVEGPDGNSLSGAVVTVTDNRNSMQQLNYNSSSCSYDGVLEEVTGDTAYILEVLSILSDDVIRLSIPYSKPENAPNVIVFQDANGNSVLNGQPILKGQAIQIGWANCGEDVVYQLTLRTSLENVYVVSSNACTVTIPAGTIPAGAYILEITAQKIYGDMYYRSFPYYSASTISAPMLSFYVN